MDTCAWCGDTIALLPPCALCNDGVPCCSCVHATVTPALGFRAYDAADRVTRALKHFQTRGGDL